MEVNFIPSVCKDSEVEVEGKKKKVKATCSGSVVVRAPSFPERSYYRKLAGLRVNKDGTADMGEDLYGNLLTVGEHVEKHVLKVDMKWIDGDSIDSFEKISYDPNLESVMYELINVLLHGVRPGKNS